MLNIVGISQDGYIRMYKIKESKNLEIFAQVNVQDKIIGAKALNISRDEICERKIAIIT
jgi:hypothetical protein